MWAVVFGWLFLSGLRFYFVFVRCSLIVAAVAKMIVVVKRLRVVGVVSMPQGV